MSSLGVGADTAKTTQLTELSMEFALDRDRCFALLAVRVYTLIHLNRNQLRPALNIVATNYECCGAEESIHLSAGGPHLKPLSQPRVPTSRL
jgi:hypothetical protein